MSLFWINCPRALTATIYIAMGWLAVIAIWPLWNAVGFAGLFWLLLGGVLYTVGGVLYALKWPARNNPASAATRSSMCSSCWAPSPTF